MSRWHESGCRQPSITLLDDVPCCTHCFALAAGVPTADNIILGSSPVRMAAIQKSDVNSSLQPTEQNLALSITEILFLDINSQEQIRVLRLNARQHSEPIHALVETISLRDPFPPSYDVVSYARLRDAVDRVEWHRIYVGSYWDIIFVPKEYEELLQSVRREDTDRTIWMECLCVDQSNIDEKTAQTILMPRTIQEASKTLMCLVPASSANDEILDFLRSNVTPSSTSAQLAHQLSTKSFKSLFRHNYFTTSQVIREVVLGKNLIMVYKQGQFPWTEQIANYLISRGLGPQWLKGRSWRHSLGPKELLQVLCDTSSYYACDNRDKIFVLHALFYMEDIIIDYQIDIRKVFTGVASYLIRQGFLHEILTIATSQSKVIELPSWAPDWSIPVERGLINLWELQDGEETDRNDESWVEAKAIDFDVSNVFNMNITFDIASGRLSAGAIRLCAISGKTYQTKRCPKVIIDRGSLGILVIDCLTGNYERGDDFVFYIPGTTCPIILRQDMERNLFSVVCRCRIWQGLPINGKEWLTPFEEFSRNVMTMQMIPPSALEVRLMHEFDRRLKGLPQMHDLPPRDSPLEGTASFQAQNLTLDFTLLSMSGFTRLEAALTDRWLRLNEDLGWIFLDQEALWGITQEMESGYFGITSGQDDIAIDDIEDIKLLQGRGVEFPLSYTWDLQKFSCYRLRAATSALLVSELRQTPLLSLFRSRVSDLREWTKVSAQLLRLFEVSGCVFKESWPELPGFSLVEEWRDMTSILPGGSDQKYHWEWSDFKAVLQLRSLIWNLPLPQQLQLSNNPNQATRLSLHCLGLNVTQMEHVTII